MTKSLRFLLPFLLVSCFLRADTDQVIGLARSYLGTESALDAVTAVRYAGTLVSSTTNDAGESQETTARIEIIFSEPFYQRIRITSAERIETTALDDYEAWQRVENPENAEQWRLTLLDTVQIRRLRANTWENLSFFKGIRSAGGKVEDMGRVQVDGKEYHKLAFDHKFGIVFYRYFNPITGRLEYSETDTGARIEEAGENFISGVRFPEQVVTTSTRADGAIQRVQVDFDEIEVNPDLDRGMFRVPSITRQ